MTVMAQATPAGAKVRSQEAVECGAAGERALAPMIGACHTCRCICLRPGEMDGTCGSRVMLHAAIRIGAETRGAT